MAFEFSTRFTKGLKYSLTGGTICKALASPVAASSWSNDYSVSCDGSNDYIDLNSNFASVFNSSFSVAFWINLPEGQPTGSGHSDSSNSNIFGLSNSGSTHRFFGLVGKGGALDAGKMRVYYKANGNQVQASSASALFSSGATGWIHVVITVEQASNGIKMYKNGSAVSVTEAQSSMSTVTMSNFAGNVDMVFGASNRGEGNPPGPNYEVDADFDEIAIFNTALSSSQVSTIYNSGDLDGHSNLEGWWRMGDGTENGSGTTVYDMSSNSSNATLVNGAKYQSFNAASSSSIELDGSNDYLSTDLVTNTHDFKNGFTASLWVKLDDNSTTQDFFGRFGDPSSRWYFGITGTKVRVAVGNNFDTTTLSHGMSTSVWYHVAYTFSGGSSGTFTYYLNGSSVGTLSFTWTSDSGSYEAVHIGALNNSTAGTNPGPNYNPTNGKLHEIAFYSSALTSSQVTAIYNSGTPTDLSSDTDLVAYWRMQGSGHTVTDSSTNSNTAILRNGTTFSTDVPVAYTLEDTVIALSGKVIWLDASLIDGSDAGNNPSDGGGVSSWVSRHSGSVTGAQSTGGNQPTFQTSEMNGKPVVNFDGTEWLELTDLTTSISNYTIFFVGNFTDGETAPNRWMFDSSGTAAGRVAFGRFKQGANGRVLFYSGTFGPSSSVFLTAAADTIFTYVLDGGSSSTTTDSYLLENAASVATGLTYQQRAIPVSTSYTQYLGAHTSTSSTYNIKMELAEFLIFNTVLSSADQGKVHDYLSDKYAISI